MFNPEDISSPESVEPGRPARWRTWLNIAIVVLVVFFSLRDPALTALGQWLVVEDKPVPADMMMVLGGSPVVRSLAAADYYRQNLAPLIFVSRGALERADLVKDLDLTGTGEWGLVSRILTDKGVPPEAIIVDTIYVGNTMAEARRAKQFIRGRRIKNFIMVTSRFHSRRAHWIFQRVLGDQVNVISLPSQYDGFNPEAWWHDRDQSKWVFLEYQKLLYNLFEFATGDD